jgi:metallo-beta-lactamase class B
VLLALAVALASTAAPAQDGVAGAKLGEDLIVRQLVPGVWLHVSFKMTEDGPLPANGLVVTTGELSLLIDTGWNPGQTRRLLDWAANTLGQPIEHVIVTHAHDDRVGGLAAVAERPIIVHGHAATDQILREAGGAGLTWSFEFEERLELGGETVDLFYPRGGHTRDNIVVWLPRRKVLFGGCLVRGLGTTTLGWTGDSDIRGWHAAMRRIIDRYPEAEIVIPGHGLPGNMHLLSHTMELLEEESRTHGVATSGRRGPHPPRPAR